MQQDIMKQQGSYVDGTMTQLSVYQTPSSLVVMQHMWKAAAANGNIKV